ncbi:polyprenol reductase 2-like [Andrographis paniculata]|uniref:polyprenol reductase 2-like n=1 Tax=Andrographis paniculata TaxID=175694 RepID=UPI0021E8DD22|nr:polyprenol reductase 2-like [Andrographis paniculata]
MASLVWLLRAAWISLILPFLIASIPSPISDSFHNRFVELIKRGKVAQSSSKRFSVPLKYFGHFYLWAVIWTTCLLVATWMYGCHLSGGGGGGVSDEVWKSVFLLVLLEIQVVRRLYESFFVLKYRPSAKLHLFGYIIGYFFYTAAGLSLCAEHVPELFRFVSNLHEEGLRTFKFDPSRLIDALIGFKWYMWLGAAIFSWGWIHQRNIHAILGSLRPSKEMINQHTIPRGDWFELVSSPHYFAEIVIYLGLVIASGCFDLTIWLLWDFVVANLTYAAAETHRWYLSKFDDYPKNRRAIFPFVY